jgi:predicted lipoprotein with Yx(FWY)xxD motif
MRVTVFLAAIVALLIVAGGSGYGQGAQTALPAELMVQKSAMGPVFADAKGLTLYMFDRDTAGKSACSGACARNWQPARAPDLANGALGEWTAVRRDDGTRQWAYKGKPVYSFSGDTKAGELTGDGADSAWHVAMVPMPPVPPTPEGVSARTADIGRVLGDAQGLTLYVYDHDTEPGKSACVDACAEFWPPLTADKGMAPAPDWTVIVRDDGSKQWAFRGKPLYRFSRDEKPGETTGDGVGAIWHALKV